MGRLAKLRRAGPAELLARGRQEAAKLGERWLGLGLGTAPAREEVDWADRFARAKCFSLEWSDRPAVVRLMETRFADQRKAILRRADRAALGRFDLLGHEGLFFGDPIDWRLEPVAGKRTDLAHWSLIDYLNPAVAGDKKITWELNRLGHFVTFGQAYWITGDERYAEAFVGQADAWIAANPPGRGINWASSLEVALRAISWSWALCLFSRSPRLTGDVWKRFADILRHHGRHIAAYSSEYFSPNTHVTGEALGLFVLGLLFGTEGAAWRAAGRRTLARFFPLHLSNDGVYYEDSTYYHRYTVDFYLYFMILADLHREPVPTEWHERLRRALDYLMWIERPDGSTPVIGDDDGGRCLMLGRREFHDFRDTLAMGAVLLGDGRWKHAAGEAPVELVWLLGPRGIDRYDGLVTRIPHDTVRCFSAGGVGVIRDGWNAAASCLVLHAGTDRAGAHCHADALAIDFSAAGTTWLVDPGTFTYTGNAVLRDEFRTTFAHNTVTVDGESQKSPDGFFSWRSTVRSSFRCPVDWSWMAVLEGRHDGYCRGADPTVHRRRVFFVRRSVVPYLVIVDDLVATGPHRHAVVFHLPPGCRAAVDSVGVSAVHPDGSRLGLTCFSSVEPAARIEAGWVSTAYGRKTEAPVAVFEGRGRGPTRYVTFVTPTKVDFRATVRRAGEITDGAGYWIEWGESRDFFQIGDRPNDVETPWESGGGPVVWGRSTGGEWVAGCLVNGSRFTLDGPRFEADGDVGFCGFERAGGTLRVTLDAPPDRSWMLVSEGFRVVINGGEVSASGRAGMSEIRGIGLAWAGPRA